MSYIENSIENFEDLFIKFENLYQNIIQSFSESYFDSWKNIETSYRLFNTKLRMAFAIREITLESFLDEKLEGMKECHLMIYKFNDLWFAYETLLILYNKFNNTSLGQGNLTKYSWITTNNYTHFLAKTEVQNSLTKFNDELKGNFDTVEKISNLYDYLTYCKEHSKGGLKTSLENVLLKIDRTEVSISDFEIKDMLSLSYAVRNNIVHNGEITVNNMNYILKKNLLKTLYKCLSILILSITVQTFNEKLIELS